MESDNRSKLEKTFDLPGTEEELLAELEDKYRFSDNPDLDEISKLALTAYKDQMLDVMNTEPKFRARLLEVAQQYLCLAKDAIAKNEDLRLKEEKQDQSKPAPKDESSDEIIDRNEVLLEIVKSNKK